MAVKSRQFKKQQVEEKPNKESDKQWKSYKKKEALKIILKTIATAGVFMIAATSPYFLSSLIRKYIKDGGDIRKRRALTRALDYAKRNQLVSFREEGGDMIMILSEAGKQKITEYAFDDMMLPQKKYWNDKWHIVIFDIPHKKKAAREALREKFQELGMVMLQKSVWVWPYECRNEIRFIQRVFDLHDKEVNYIIADYVEDESILKKHFNL